MPVARHGALPTRLAQGRLDAKIINPSRLAFNTESLRFISAAFGEPYTLNQLAPPAPGPRSPAPTQISDFFNFRYAK